MFVILKKLWLKLRVNWSNFLYAKKNSDIECKNKLNSVSQIQLLAKDIYSKFIYTYDSVFELFDAMRTPSSCYEDYINGGLADDCDGFHAALYYPVEKNGFECYLLTYITTPIKESHTVLLVKIDNKYHVFDYKNHFTLQSKDIKTELEDRHNIRIDCWNLVQFKNGKYEIVNGE